MKEREREGGREGEREGGREGEREGGRETVWYSHYSHMHNGMLQARHVQAE